MNGKDKRTWAAYTSLPYRTRLPYMSAYTPTGTDEQTGWWGWPVGLGGGGGGWAGGGGGGVLTVPSKMLLIVPSTLLDSSRSRTISSSLISGNTSLTDIISLLNEKFMFSLI